MPHSEASVTTASGHGEMCAAGCPGRTTAKAAAVGAEVAVTIRCPRRDVAAVMFNPRFDTAWIGGLRKSKASSPGPLRNGAKVVRSWRRFGRSLAETSEVVGHVPDRSLEMTTQLPFGLSIRYELEGIPEGTIARICVEGRVTGLLRFAAITFDQLLRSAVVRDLGRLKHLVESGAGRTRSG